MSSRIQIRRDTAANWYSVNPELLSGELGYETDTSKLKIGTGAHWNDTPYFVYENTKLNNLNDVTITDVANGDFLRWNGSGSVWVNDAVNLSTDTVGDYVQSLVEGTGLTITNNSGEGSTPTIAIGQDVATTASVQFAKVDTTGDVTVGGNLTVNGTTTTLNTENLSVEDNFIILNSNVSASPSLDAGIEVERGLLPNVILRWNETTEKWQVSEDGVDYNDIINTYSLEQRLNTFSYANDARLATYAVLPNSPTYTPGTLDADGGYGIGATLESSVNARLVVDGIEANNDNRILVKNQIDATENGMYLVVAQGSASAHWILERVEDMNGHHPNQVHRGENLDCQEGDKNSNQSFVISSSGTGTNGAHIIGTDDIHFVQTTGVYSFTAGEGLSVVDNTIDLGGITQEDVSGSPSLVFISSIERDGYGRILGITTGDAQVTLGENTTGNFVASLVAGTGVSVSEITGEGSTPTISIGQEVNTSSSVTFSHVSADLTGDVTGNASTATSLETARAISLSGDVSGSVSFDGSSNVNISATIEPNSVSLGDDTTGDYVESLVQGTGVIITNNSGEGATPAIAIGQDVATSASVQFASVTAPLVGNASTASSLETARTISLSGDVSGSVSFDGAANAEITATIQPNSVELGSDTTGSYVESLVQGTGVTIADNSGEGATPSISIGQDVATSASVQFAAVTAELIGNASTADALSTARTIALTGDVSGSVSFDGSASAEIVTTLQPNSISLGTDTTGDYVSSLVAGTGISLSDNSGESATPTISIGQEVGTSASVTFAHVSADVTGNLTGNVTGNVTGDVTGSSGSTTGNAATATTLETARTISLTGDVSGSVSFDGSSDVSITATTPSTLTGRTINLTDNTLTGTKAEFDAALSDGTFVDTDSDQDLYNKTLYGGTFGEVDGINKVDVARNSALSIQSGLFGVEIKVSQDNETFKKTEFLAEGAVRFPSEIDFEGSTGAYRTRFVPTEPTAINEITIPDASGTIALNGAISLNSDMSDVTFSSGGYAIGDTGPAGGKIFITPTTAGNTTGKYFEAATLAYDVERNWCEPAYETTLVSGADGTAIGTGQQNTLDIVAQGNTDPALSAAAYANNFTLNGFSDWFLPSKDELHELAVHNSIFTGWLNNYYWSSSEIDEDNVWSDYINFQFQSNSNQKNYTLAVLPIRSFTVSGPIDNVLVWNGTAWVNQNSIHLTSTTNATDSDSGALIVDGGVGIKGDIHTDGVIHAGTAPTVSLDNAVAYFSGDESGVVQLGLQNQSSASVSSADYVATADNGNDTSNYLDLGINSSTYADPAYNATGPNDAYLYVDGGHLVIGTATGDKDIKFNIGGTQSTDIMGTWSETVLDIATDLSVSGSASFGNIDTANATVNALTADSGLFESTAASVVATTVKAHSSQSANLTEWKNSAGTVLASVDKDGKITSPTFVGTNIGNLSFYGINTSASTIYKGQPIYLTGLDVPSGNPTIALANVADPAKMPGAGVVAEDILAGDTGEVVMIGQIHNVDTSGWNYNDILYVDGLGTLTNVRPTDPNHSVQTIGNVEKVGTALGGGAILVNSTGTYVVAPNTIAIPGSVTASAGFYGSGANVTSLNANNLSSGTVPSARLSLTSSDIPTLTHSKISDFETTAKSYTLDSFAAPVAAVSMNSQKITNMADPTSGSDAATKTYVDNLSSGLRIKQAVNWATNAILPNTPTYTDGAADSSQGLGDGAYLAGATNTRLAVDGNNVTTGQRVLVKNQATASHNGIYYVTEQGGGGNVWRLTRADDSNNTPAGEVRKGDYVSVLGGSANAGTSWTIANDGTATTPINGIKIGTDAINWIQFNGAASYVAGGGMTLSGTTFDVVSASSDRIVVNADSIDLATVSRIDSTNSASVTFIGDITTDTYGRVTAVTKGDIKDATTSVKGIASFDSGDFAVTSGAVTIKTGGVGNTQLENSSVTIGSSSVSLGGTTSSLTGLSSVSATTFTGNLTGNVSGNATSVTNGVYTTDTGTVTNTMLAGSIADTKLSTISTAGKVSNSATTATSSNTGSAIVARDASGNFTANIITASLSGNASTATSATTATNATNTAITDTTTTAGTYYPVFSSASSGNAALRTDSTGLTYNPSTNALTATTFSGALSGNATTATSAATLTTARTISLGGDLSGSVSFNGSQDVTITAAIGANSVALGTDTTGDYVGSLVAGTGVTLSNNSGEGATPTVAIGQSVSTTASPTFATVTGTATPGLVASYAAGDEGGEILLYKPVTNTTIAGTGVTIDIWQNKLRIFEQGGSARGAYIDLTACSAGVATNLIGSTINSLDDIGDVTAPTPSSGDFLKFNGTAWVNASGVVTTADTGTVTSTMLAGSIADSKLSTISTAGKVSNSATTATSANTASAIVARDASGNFTAGTITATAIATATTYVGTTAIALNRSSANLALTGISSVALPGSTSGTVTLQPTATAGTTTITLPATTGTVITTGDTGTITGTMIADGTIVNAEISASAAIALSKLASGTSAQIVLANSGGVPTYTSVSGDVTITNTGVTSIKSNVALSGAPTAATATAGTNTTQIATTAFTTTAVRDSLVRLYMEVM